MMPACWGVITASSQNASLSSAALPVGFRLFGLFRPLQYADGYNRQLAEALKLNEDLPMSSLSSQPLSLSGSGTF